MMITFLNNMMLQYVLNLKKKLKQIYMLVYINMFGCYIF